MVLGEFERGAVRVFIALLGLSGPLLKRLGEYTVHLETRFPYQFLDSAS
jgi:hypothetical protein